MAIRRRRGRSSKGNSTMTTPLSIVDRRGRILIAWCPDDEVWLPAEWIGQSCAFTSCYRTLLKRRAYRCGDTCDEDRICFTLAELDEHRREYHGEGEADTTP